MSRECAFACLRLFDCFFRNAFFGLCINCGMNGFQKTAALLLLAAVLLFMIYLPQCADKMLERDQYREWLEPAEEEFSGVISVWHVVRFKPYLGSVGTWLKKIADRTERRHFGVYFEVESISEAEAETRLANGEFPDVISFPVGFLNGEELRTLNGTELFGTDGGAVDFGDGYSAGALPAGFDSGRYGDALRALPYAAGCTLALFYPERVTAAEMAEVLKSISNGASAENVFSDDALTDGREYVCSSVEDFKKGKGDFCIGDARTAGDMERLAAANKAKYFEVLPFCGETDEVQFVGISAAAEREKIGCISEFIAGIFSAVRQSELCALGLMPMNPSAERKYEQPFLTEAYGLLHEGILGLPNAFVAADGENGRR